MQPSSPEGWIQPPIPWCPGTDSTKSSPPPWRKTNSDQQTQHKQTTHIKFTRRINDKTDSYIIHESFRFNALISLMNPILLCLCLRLPLYDSEDDLHLAQITDPQTKVIRDNQFVNQSATQSPLSRLVSGSWKHVYIYIFVCVCVYIYIILFSWQLLQSVDVVPCRHCVI